MLYLIDSSIFIDAKDRYKDILLLDKSIPEKIFEEVVNEGYASDLSAKEYEDMGRSLFDCLCACEQERSHYRNQ